MSELWYTGIGPEDAPSWACDFAKELGTALDLKGWNLRSNGKAGMCEAFERVSPNREAWVCSSGYRKDECFSTKYRFSLQGRGLIDAVHYLDKESISPGIIRHSKAVKMEDASQFHSVAGEWDDVRVGSNRSPALSSLRPSDVSKMVIIYTESTSSPFAGYPAVAVRTARHFGVPVYNLYDKAHREFLTREFIR